MLAMGTETETDDGAEASTPFEREDTDRELDVRFSPFAGKMRDAGLSDQVIESFRDYYGQLLHGETGHIPASEAQPLDDLPALDDLNGHGASARAALDRTVVITLNGGLGTTMGLVGPKSSIIVKEGLTFLDIAIHQVMHMRRHYDVRLPMVLMNSFNTRSEALSKLESYPELEQDIPWDFMQHKVPKIWKSDLSPVVWPADPELEWCPPGHGDIYLALQTSGMLEKMLANGYEYAFISNIDNLGATVDMDTLGYFSGKDIPILMEAARRTAADRKGGHLAQHPDKGLILREVAQCPPDEMDDFQDTARYRYFNTNNLWINLCHLASMLDEHDGMLSLPLIRNEKTVDPQDPNTPAVYQLETAMGQAIAVFPRAQAVQVPRSRFLPVKDTNDLLAIWSDAFRLEKDYSVHPSRPAAEIPHVDLDERYYGLFNQLQERFPNGAPSLVNCTSFRVRGDVHFDDPVAFTGDVCINHTDETPLHYTSTAHGQENETAA
jgi:UTP--glucose-1-phosphate uridylyltransferase